MGVKYKVNQFVFKAYFINGNHIMVDIISSKEIATLLYTFECVECLTMTNGGVMNNKYRLSMSLKNALINKKHNIAKSCMWTE